MLKLPVDWTLIQTVLCIGAHCDDIEIGCAGTLIELTSRNPRVGIHWVVLSGDEGRPDETRKAAAAIRVDGSEPDVTIRDFKGSYFPDQWAAIKDHFEELRSRISPDLIFTHRRRDRHQDHRIVADLTWNTYRDHLILEYEIPKFEGDLGRPNLYVPLGAENADRKVRILMDCFPSQRKRAWFRPELFRGLMAVRGIECNAVSGYAEAFEASKLVV